AELADDMFVVRPGQKGIQTTLSSQNAVKQWIRQPANSPGKAQFAVQHHSVVGQSFDQGKVNELDGPCVRRVVRHSILCWRKAVAFPPIVPIITHYFSMSHLNGNRPLTSDSLTSLYYMVFNGS